MPVSRQLLKPVSLGFILFTIVVALTTALIPWGPTVRAILPDGVALVLFYWCMYQSRRVGMGWAFWLGIVLDIADGNVFGQHGIAYCLTAWFVLARHRQLGMFPLWQQALYIGPLLFASQLIMLVVRMATGSAFPGWFIFIGALTGAVFWPLLSQLLQMQQRTEKRAEIQS
ncbi:rod shape-determining protein MreD [Chitinimonas sp. BJB300]|uniref:rod shape-determining protein MreD n=1 Tax=Chitinimonas sp. BJB300 TaxID=1559339 RepID=UPI000C0D3A75|nr:rod shape-determining protein MreD [Chitinimonas sp. BJB300]PHV12640.1 rod shape-determining protein MreD [Chitinimonas sp. BJB300]TSJ91174.1 rod shape-determining protein MreD [Chitinimonas sp. BJB300]